MWPFPLTHTFPLYVKQLPLPSPSPPAISSTLLLLPHPHFSSSRSSLAFSVSWILLGSAVEYILLATLTLSPQMSKWSLLVPITPDLKKNATIFSPSLIALPKTEHGNEKFAEKNKDLNCCCFEQALGKLDLQDNLFLVPKQERIYVFSREGFSNNFRKIQSTFFPKVHWFPKLSEKS